MNNEQYVTELLAEEATNVFGKLGRAYLKAIRKVLKTQNQNDKSFLFQTLDCMALEDGYSLGLRLAEDKGMGDESWFFVYETEKGPEEYLSQINYITAHFVDHITYDHILVQRTEMGAWQAYLYTVAKTMLPTFWHGGYIVRKYIFKHDDLNDVPALLVDCIDDQVLFGIKEKVSPEIKMQGNEAIVKCCYWNEWRGLVRDTVKILFDGNSIVGFEPLDLEVLYEYNCGICF